MTSSDTTKFFPILSALEIVFFSDKSIYSDNSSDRVFSEYEYSVPAQNSRRLSYNKHNGLRMYDGHGFSIETDNSARTLELIFTPDGGSNVLFSSNAKIYEWSSLGVISKSGISAVYVNNKDVTTSTNISEFLSTGQPHHIIIVFSTDATSNLKLNQNQTDSSSGGPNLYNNLAIYEYAFTAQDVNQHYYLYTGNTINLINDTSLSISELATGSDDTAFFLIVRETEAVSI